MRSNDHLYHQKHICIYIYVYIGYTYIHFCWLLGSSLLRLNGREPPWSPGQERPVKELKASQAGGSSHNKKDNTKTIKKRISLLGGITKQRSHRTSLKHHWYQPKPSRYIKMHQGPLIQAAQQRMVAHYELQIRCPNTALARSAARRSAAQPRALEPTRCRRHRSWNQLPPGSRSSTCQERKVQFPCNQAWSHWRRARERASMFGDSELGPGFGLEKTKVEPKNTAPCQWEDNPWVGQPSQHCWFVQGLDQPNGFWLQKKAWWLKRAQISYDYMKCWQWLGVLSLQLSLSLSLSLKPHSFLRPCS